MGGKPRGCAHVTQIALDDGCDPLGQTRIVTPANVQSPHSLYNQLYHSLRSIYLLASHHSIYQYNSIHLSMVNTFNTEPDPEPDLEPDIRGYSQSNSNQVNGGITTSIAQPPSESNPLSFVSSEKPTPVAPVATCDVPINEKDYATPGTASTGTGTMETTLNPSPSRQDQTSIYSSHHDDDEDEEPAFPFISWKQSAIVSN